MFGPNLQHAAVALEAHQDGQPHLHMAVFLANKQCVTLDALNRLNSEHKKTHVLLGGTRQEDRAKMYLYCCKEGKYVQHNEKDLEKFEKLRNKSSARAKNEAIANALMSVTTETINDEIEKLIRDDPYRMMMHLKKIEEFGARCALMNQSDALLEWRGIEWLDCENVGGNAQGKGLVDMVNTMFPVDGTVPERRIRDPQIWIFGTPGCGKTWFRTEMEKRIRTYVWNYSNFQTPDLTNKPRLICFDEFQSNVPFAQFLSILDGSSMKIDMKSRNAYLKRTNVPVIVTCNFSPNECYQEHLAKHPHQRAALPGRVRSFSFDNQNALFRFIRFL